MLAVVEDAIPVRIEELDALNRAGADICYEHLLNRTPVVIAETRRTVEGRDAHLNRAREAWFGHEVKLVAGNNGAHQRIACSRRVAQAGDFANISDVKPREEHVGRAQ